jgi:hypothetical protein
MSFTDGRDVSPHAAVHDLATLPADRIATVVGRYYAMDRDERWDRTERALAAIVAGEGRRAADPVAAVQESYDEDVTDEFVEPVVLGDRPRLAPGDDAAILFNFRPDRARQLSRKLLDAGVDLTTMTRYREDLACPVAFPEQEVHETLAEVLSKRGLRQLHAAETEKYAHVTYFFNGGVEREWEGETRILVPSPRDVPSYDHKPQMSADEGREAVLRGGRGRLRVRGRQLREPGHGRPHGLDPGRREGRRDRRRVPGARAGRGRRSGRRDARDRRPRQRRDHARARRRQPAHRPHDEPRPARADAWRRFPAGGRRALRPRTDHPRPTRPRKAGRDVGEILTFCLKSAIRQPNNPAILRRLGAPTA